MKDFLDTTVPIFVIVVFILGFIWGVIALGVGFVNAQNQMNWCQYKNGDIFYDSEKENEGPTGKRWSPNILTIGLTGECIEPGDKGL